VIDTTWPLFALIGLTITAEGWARRASRWTVDDPTTHGNRTLDVADTGRLREAGHAFPGRRGAAAMQKSLVHEADAGNAKDPAYSTDTGSTHRSALAAVGDSPHSQWPHGFVEAAARRRPSTTSPADGHKGQA
jgi:hypothetical protein